MSNKEVFDLKNELREVKNQLLGLKRLMEDHIKSENDLLVAWNGFKWSKQVAIKVATFIGVIVGITLGALQIIRCFK